MRVAESGQKAAHRFETELKRLVLVAERVEVFDRIGVVHRTDWCISCEHAKVPRTPPLFISRKVEPFACAMLFCLAPMITMAICGGVTNVTLAMPLSLGGEHDAP